MTENLSEIQVLDNIKAAVLNDMDEQFVAVIVNKNMVQTEAKITISKNDDSHVTRMMSNSSLYRITFKFDDSGGNNLGYNVAWDEFDLFWVKQWEFYSGEKEKVNLDDMANEIWLNWLEKVGIVV